MADRSGDRGGTVEHRCGERIPLILAATLHRDQGLPVRCTILNLSCGGALVAAHGEPGPLRGLVELELRLPYAEPRLCRWRGYVKHQGPGGIGIMFDDLHLPELLPLLGVERTMRRLRRQQATAPTL